MPLLNITLYAKVLIHIDISGLGDYSKRSIYMYCWFIIYKD